MSRESRGGGGDGTKKGERSTEKDKTDGRGCGECFIRFQQVFNLKFLFATNTYP